MRVGAVGARCARAAGPTRLAYLPARHLLASDRPPGETSLNRATRNSQFFLAVCLQWCPENFSNRLQIGYNT